MLIRESNNLLFLDASGVCDFIVKEDECVSTMSS